MNLKFIDKDENELYLQDEDLNYINSKLLSIGFLMNDEPTYIIPTHNLKNGIIFQGDQFRKNNGSHYAFNSNSIDLSDSNDQLNILLKTEYRTNYTYFLRFFKDITETQPHFLKNKADMKNVQIEWKGDIESSFLNIRYNLGRKNEQKHIPIVPSSFGIPLKIIFNNERDIYRSIILDRMYSNHFAEFKNDYTREEFLEHAEDIFMQRKMLDY